LEELIQVKGIVLRIIDTAGIRHTQDTVEKIGVERAKTEAEGADFVIYVADASRDLDENDEAVISMIQEKKAVVLLNKSDLFMKVTKEKLEKKTGKQVFLISAKEEKGLNAFAEAVEECFIPV
jgi:tRNA modification GTPase